VAEIFLKLYGAYMNIDVERNLPSGAALILRVDANRLIREESKNLIWDY
jgi:hypothetical protein